MSTGEVKVYLRFDLPLSDQREEFMKRLRGVTATDFDLQEHEADVWLHFLNADENAALVRSQVVVRGLCDGTDIEPGLIALSLGGWPAD